MDFWFQSFKYFLNPYHLYIDTDVIIFFSTFAKTNFFKLDGFYGKPWFDDDEVVAARDRSQKSLIYLF